MFKDKIEIQLLERKNVHAKRGKEWALNVRFPQSNFWTIEIWDKKPKENEIRNTIAIIVRSMEIYHAHISKPNFKMEVTMLDEINLGDK